MKNNDEVNYQWAPWSDVFADPMSQNLILGAAAAIIVGMVWVVAYHGAELSRFLN